MTNEQEQESEIKPKSPRGRPKKKPIASEVDGKNVAISEEFKKLGDKIRQAQVNYDSADKNLNLVQKTVLQLEAHSGEVVVIEN